MAAEYDERMMEVKAEQERLSNILPPPQVTVSEEGLRKVIGYIQERQNTGRRFFAENAGKGELSPEAKAELDQIHTTSMIAHFVLSELLKPNEGERSWDNFFEDIEKIDGHQRRTAIVLDIAEEIGGEELRQQVEAADTTIPRRMGHEVLETLVPDIRDWITYRCIEADLGTQAAEDFYAKIQRSDR